MAKEEKIPRRAPRSLPIHMGMASSYWQNGFASGEFDAQGVYGSAQDMMRGIQAYLNHPYCRGEVDYECVFAAGEVRVLKKPGAQYNANMPAVLLMPSLINKFHILDLMEKRSLFDYLAARGIAVYVIDWGDIQKDSAADSLDPYMQQRIIAAIGAVKDVQQNRVHVLGYCMGGTLAVAAAALARDYVASCVTLAAPWDFHGGHAALANRVKFWAPTLMPSLEDKGYMSIEWLQSLFASLDPAMSVQKFSKFADMDQCGAAADLFVAVEDWLNDGVALPAPLAQHIVQEWFLDNTPAQSTWQVCGSVIDAAALDIPALVIASSKDKLVEYESAHPLARTLPKAQHIDPACGHIGMIAGSNAIINVWEPIADWLCHD